MKIDVEKSLAAIAEELRISHPAAESLRTLLTFVAEDQDCPLRSLDQLAYLLATANWETAHTFKPIIEAGPDSYFEKYETGNLGAELGNTQPGDGAKFRGRGYVQLTGRGSYAKAGAAIGVALVDDPRLACDPENAYRIASRGMAEGWFTRQTLDMYLPESGSVRSFFHARRIINGHDHANEIASVAERISKALRAAA